MKKIDLFILSLITMIISTSQAQDLSVYVSAHPDDWQLFMNPNAYDDIRDNDRKVVFIHTTAGDAGEGIGKNSYYKAREEGSLRAIRFLRNTLEESGLGIDMTEQTVEINGHQMVKYEYGGVISYFLRLPDGNFRGPGYEIHNYTSLEKLHRGSIEQLKAIDGSTTYQSADDLRETLVALLKSEGKNIELNIAETDSIANPDDHSDHRYSSHFFQDIISASDVVNVRYYEEYSTNKKPMNVEGAAFLISAGCWGATASGLSDMEHYSTWDTDHNSWIGRQYFREEQIQKSE